VGIGFQPILINYYNATGRDIGIIYSAILVFGLIPPLAVAFLSKYLQDRQIVLIGLIIKLIGVSLFLPIFGKIHEWQVVVGYMLVFKATIFFWTASMSLFTKLLGPMSNGTLLGILSSAAQIGPALAQFFFAEWTFKVFGTARYASFAIPVAISTALVVWPAYWRRMDSDDEFTHVLLSQYEILQSKRKSKQ